MLYQRFLLKYRFIIWYINSSTRALIVPLVHIWKWYRMNRTQISFELRLKKWSNTGISNNWLKQKINPPSSISISRAFIENDFYLKPISENFSPEYFKTSQTIKSIGMLNPKFGIRFRWGNPTIVSMAAHLWLYL